MSIWSKCAVPGTCSGISLSSLSSMPLCWANATNWSASVLDNRAKPLISAGGPNLPAVKRADRCAASPDTTRHSHGYCLSWRIAPSGRSRRLRHPPRYAAFLRPPSPSFGHSSALMPLPLKPVRVARRYLAVAHYGFPLQGAVLQTGGGPFSWGNGATASALPLGPDNGRLSGLGRG